MPVDELADRLDRIEATFKAYKMHANDCHGAAVDRSNRMGGMYYTYDPERCTCWIEDN